jgi:hypothetical protein
MYWVQPVTSGNDVGTAEIASASGDYLGGGTEGSANGNPYTVTLVSTAAQGETVNFRLYASIEGTSGIASRQGFNTSA